MGVSALDGARLGMPVVLLDFSYHPLSGHYEYKYIYETKNYTLGRDIGAWAYKQGNQSLENMLDELHDADKYKKVCDLCYQYYELNHNINSVASRLLEAIEQCNLHYYKIHSLRNNFIMKVLIILKGWTVQRW